MQSSVALKVVCSRSFLDLYVIPEIDFNFEQVILSPYTRYLTSQDPLLIVTLTYSHLS